MKKKQKSIKEYFRKISAEEKANFDKMVAKMIFATNAPFRQVTYLVMYLDSYQISCM